MPVPYRHRGIAEARRAELDRVDNMLVKPTNVSGRILVRGTGELAYELSFPVVFVEVPIMSFGGELDQSDFAESSRFPTVSVVVLNWLKYKPREDSEIFFNGARLGIVIKGKRNQNLWVHWTATGSAMRNPIGGLDSVGGGVI
jgi:hypothetical protein